MEESIEGMAKALRLQNARRHYRELVDEALAAGLGYEQFLRLVFERECESRSAKAVEKKIRSARFPYIKTFDEMDWSAFSVPVARTIRELQSLSFAREGRNVVLIGNPGTGKTHTAIALGDERPLRKRAQFGFGAQGGHGRKAICLLQKEVHVIRFGHTRRTGLHLLRQRGVRIAFQPPVEPKRKEVDGVHDEPAIRQMGAFVRGHDDGGGDDRQNRQQSQRHPNHRGLL